MASPQVSVVVLTGGPCGGKSTFLPQAKQWLENHGCTVGILAEGATEVITGGFPPNGPWADSLTFQEHILEYQLERENRYTAMLQAVRGDKPRVLLCDRGALDPIAFVGRSGFLEVLRRSGRTLASLRDRYTSVVHLMSTARGARDFYTLANNQARSETPDQAEAVDIAMEQAWLGHPHYAMIDNKTNFAEKIRRAFNALARVLHMPVPLEIERKFLVLQRPAIPTPHVAVEIEQVYLSAGPGDERRLRKRTLDGVSTYFYTTKSYTDQPGVRMERERQVELGEYEALLRERLPQLEVIRKTRYCFLHAGQHLELDVYRGELEGLVVLEAEVAAITDPVEIPPGFEVREITGQKEYSNRILAATAATIARRTQIMPDYKRKLEEWLS